MMLEQKDPKREEKICERQNGQLRATLHQQKVSIFQGKNISINRIGIEV